MEGELLKASSGTLSRPLAFLARLAYSSQLSLPIVIAGMFLMLGVQIEFRARVSPGTNGRQEAQEVPDVADSVFEGIGPLSRLEDMVEPVREPGEGEVHSISVVARVEVVRMWRGG
jgi:hypothetical protein